MATTSKTLVAKLGSLYADMAASVFYTVISSGDDPLIARTNTGVTQLITGSGTYRVGIDTWDDAWTGIAVWDVSAAALAMEAFVGIQDSYDPYIRSIVANLGSLYADLSTIGYTVYDTDDNVLIARTTTGVTQLADGSGTYYANVAGWDPTWVGHVDWDNNGTPLDAVETFDATDVVPADLGYDPIYAWIRSRLLDSVTSLANSYFDMDIESEIRRILSPYSLVYADITDATDLANFNEAVGLMVAARLQVPLTTGGGTSALASESVAGVGGESLSRTFQSAATGDQCDLWLMQAKQALAQISFVKTRSGSNNSRFARDGRRRQIDAQETCCDWRDC